jgi:hypothetical protein
MADGELQPRRSTARLWIMAALAIIAAILTMMAAAALVGGARGRTALSRRLPDGTMLRLDAVTYGRQHSYEPGFFRLSRWRSWLPFLPWSPVFEERTEDDALVFWMSRRSASGRFLGFEWWDSFAAVDRHGCRFFGDGQLHMSEASPGGTSSSSVGGGRLAPTSPRDGMVVGYCLLQPFPRREPTVRLRIYGDNPQPVAEYTVPNPAPGPYPNWTPEPLPITKRDGDLAITLTRLQLHIPRGRPPADFVGDYGETEFHFAQNGRLTKEWEVSDPVLLDATGNACHLHQISLCPHETAWKLRARFFRNPRARFTPQETCTLTNIPAPDPGSVRLLGGSTRLQGVNLQPLAIAAAGTVSYTNGVPRMAQPADPRARSGSRGFSVSTSGSNSGTVVETSSEFPHVAVRTSLVPDGWRLTVRAVDDRGRVTPGEFPSVGDDIRFFNLDLPPNSRRLTLTFALHRARTAEFLVRPPRPQKS